MWGPPAILLKDLNYRPKLYIVEKVIYLRVQMNLNIEKYFDFTIVGAIFVKWLTFRSFLEVQKNLKLSRHKHIMSFQSA